jgi:hypothetical protein
MSEPFRQQRRRARPGLARARREDRLRGMTDRVDRRISALYGSRERMSWKRRNEKESKPLKTNDLAKWLIRRTE